MAYTNGLNIEDSIKERGYTASEHYENARPSYPREGVELLMNKLGLIGEKRDKATQLTVLELGAGTGKFTRVMAEVLRDANVRIIASDPVKEMCEQFKKTQPDIEIRQFGGENIDLPDGSVDVVIAATSFHWFCYKENSFPEMHRVLSPNGMLGVTWLHADNKSQPFVQEVFSYLVPYFSARCQDFTIDSEEEKIVEQIPLSKRFSQPESALFLSHPELSAEQFYQLALSYGVVQAMSQTDLEKFTNFFNKVMSDHEVKTGKEITTLTHRCSLYWCKRLEYN